MPTTNPMLDQALAQVKAALAAQIAPLQNQQKQAAQDARNAAIGTQSAYQAAAGMAEPLAGQIGQTYSSAADAQAGFAKGFSDEVQKTLGGSADQANKLLAQNGSPQHVNAPQISDVLYGLGGYNPATLLNTAGAAFKSAAAQQPDTLRGLGLQGYQQQIAQGKTAQQRIQDQIDAVNAQTPALTQTALSGLQSANADAQQSAFNRWLQTQQLGVSKQNANKPDFFGSAEGGYYAFDPASGKIQNVIAGTGPAPLAPKIIGSDKTGRFAYDPNTQQLTPLIDPLKPTPKPKFTPVQRSAFMNQAATAAKFAWQGEYDPKKKEWLSQPQRYMDALAAMVDHGIPPGIAEKSLNRYWSRPGYGAEVDAREKWVESGMKGNVPMIRTDAARPNRPLYSGKAAAAAEPAAYRRFANLAPGADRAGATTSPAVVEFVGKVGRMVGRKLTITTGTNHNEYVVGTDRVSDHWAGEAADIGGFNGTPGGRVDQRLTRLGQTALIAAGADPKWARQQRGGLFNVGGYQIIFNSTEGGNHYNHLHVGIRRSTV